MGLAARAATLPGLGVPGLGVPGLVVPGLVALTLAVLAPAPSGMAKSRVETGRDLYIVCRQALADHDAGRTAQGSVAILHCNRYLAGLFRAHEAMTRNRETAAVTDNDDPERVQCLRVPRVASFHQLARRIVRQGEWTPELLNEPATALAFRAFDALNPC